MSKNTNDKIEFDFAQIGGVKLHYAKAGTGEKLVLLLHGFPEFWYSWRHQLADLSDEYTVVAPDLRGYNLSDKPQNKADYDIELLADDVIGLIDHFGVEKAAIVGHDWGGGVAWAVAGRNPERVSKLACLQVPPASVWKKNQTLKQFFASWYMFFFQIPKLPEWKLTRNDYQSLAVALKTTTAEKGVFTTADIKEYKRSWSESGAITAALNYYRANIIKRMFGRGPDPEKIKVPTLFIYGEQDTAILPDTIEGVGDFIDSEYTELRIPESGHWVQAEARQKVTDALREFLAD
ncbi:MAG: alpha/beta hydrolase [Pyrinomonadaceae bacterium]|nr:alpha/beta hydrolase [Pyrinomonadaceae bacterium]